MDIRKWLSPAGRVAFKPGEDDDTMPGTSTAADEDKIGSLLIHVYGDGKKLSLSANSFPMRVVTSRMSHGFSFNDPSQETKLDKDLQYVTPASHLELLKCIVESDRQSLSQKIHNSIAISLRCDGSVDRTQVDKIYVLAKLITMSGDEDTIFLGVHEPETRGAHGVFNAVEQACINTVGREATQEIFSNMSSIVTDGASVNTGEKKGIWAAFDKIESEVPKMKIWCAVHRSQLAWKSITGKYGINEISHLIQTLSGISSFFHTSGVRTRELNDLAVKHGLKCRAMPRVFEVRWTEFTSSLVNAILTSWHALVLYFQISKDKAAHGFLTLLTNKSVLELMAFVADVLTVFSRFQKKIQSNSVTLLNLDSEISLVVSNLAKIKDTQLLGGWVATLQTQLESTEEEGHAIYRLKNITLGEERGRRNKDHHLFVTGKRENSAIQNELVQSLSEFLVQRFDCDKHMNEVLVPFLKLQEDADIKAVHQLICPDLDLEELGMEYQDLVFSGQGKDVNLNKLVKYLVSKELFPSLVKALSRVVAAKPHSADVERLISSSNALKTCERSRMSVETENLYLYVHYNMPPLEEFDPREAVMIWLSSKARRNKTHEKAKFQVHFKGVFSEIDFKVENDDHDVEVKSKKVKKF